MDFKSNFISAVIILTAISTISFAQGISEDGLNVSGYIESYYSYDFDEPDDHSRPFFIYNFNRSNEVNVNLAFVKLTYLKERVRGNLALMAGTYANANLASETGVLKNIFEANAGVKLSKDHELWIDAGILPSHIGFESAIGKDCWTLTRSIPAEGSPYYEAAVRFSYGTENGDWYFAGLVMNGWQRITRVNGNNTPAFGTQVTYKIADKLLLNNSTYIGNDNPDSLKAARYFADTYLIWSISERFSLTAGYDIGIQQKSSGSDDYMTWYSPVAVLKAVIGKGVSASLRGEYFHDPSQVIFATGTENGFRTFGYSLNVDYKVTDNALVRIEGRGFDSKDKIFSKNGVPGNSNFAITTSIAVSF
ncbi:MAG: porin [Ignavibacteria bacterium]|nr:porin [Ignavibacteria bacterium]